mmetsp:Transcript_68179/g.197661  ORF Transcript_68179/g.197661 Transcript_68179/m.197661 type:complete len:515 (+) Transcript_68179:3-1547(+)
MTSGGAVAMSPGGRSSPKAMLGKSRSTPAMASVSTFANTSLTALSEADGLLAGDSADDERGGGGGVFSHHGGSQSCSFSATWLPDGGRMDATFSMCRSAKAPRFEGSMDRMNELPMRAGHPKAKFGQSVTSFGKSAAVTYPHSPTFSFRGGKSRMEDSPSPARKREAKTSKPEDLELQPRRRKQLSRGFGTEVRLRYRGGAMQLPPSPGPAAYEVPREADVLPKWAPSSALPWGKRTASRPELVNPTATDAGPGEYTVDHPFQTAAPAPLFGQPVTERTKDNFPAPNAYEVPTSVGAGTSVVIGPGQRPQWTSSDAPGPGAYSPDIRAVDPHSYGAVFGSVERRHESDDVDPDEPPGPGTHEVRRPPVVGVGLSKADTRKEIVGLGPKGIPGPGQYKVPTPEGKRIGIHGSLPRKPRSPKPGPGHYEPSDHLLRHTMPATGVMNYTAPRRSPFVNESGTEKTQEATLRRCALEVAQVADEFGFGPKQKKEQALLYVPSGPSHSFGARRPVGSFP